MSYTSQTKGDRNKAKFQASNINNVFKGKSTETQQKTPHRQYGMQVLGRVSNVRRMPRPSVLPSLKAETGGNDPRVNLVPPGGQGWGGSSEAGGMIVRNSRAEALLDSPPHQQTTGASSAQGGRAGGTQPVSSGAEARSWSRVTGGNVAGVGGPGGGGGGGGSGGGGSSSGTGSSSGGGHNGWAPASGGNQGLSAASQRDFPKLGASSAAPNANSSDTSLRPQGSLSGNWRDRGRTGGVTVAASTQQQAPLSPTSVPENTDVSGGVSGVVSQGGPVSGGSRASAAALATSTNSRLPTHHTAFSGSVVGGNSRTFAETGSSIRFDGTGTAASGGGNRTAGKIPSQTRTSAPLRTTLDDKAASTAPTGWAADQGELDFSERIVFSDEEDESPLPSKPKQMVGDDKVMNSGTNGDANRPIIPAPQISPELPMRGDPSITMHTHGMTGNDMKIPSHRPTGQIGQDSITNRKSDEPDSIGMGAPQRPVVGLMQISPGPGPTAHHMSLTHPHQSQQHNNFSVSAVREAWPSGQVTSGQQHQGAAQYPPMLYTNSRVNQAPYPAPPPTSLHPNHPFNSNPGPLMTASVPSASHIFGTTHDDKHLSDQRNNYQKEFKSCVERARMKKRTDESDARAGVATPSSLEEERDGQRPRPRQRFDAPSTSSKGSISDAATVDECESRSLPTAPREETGPPGGPPMPPVPIVAPAPPPAHSYPVPHGLPPTHFGAITPTAAAHFGPRGPWPGAHPAGATAATYPPHPAAQHPSFAHHYPPPAPLPTHLLDPNMRPKNPQEYTALMEKFQEFLLNESKRTDKSAKAEGDRTGQMLRQTEGMPKKVVEQTDPFAEEDGHENREPTALASGDISTSAVSQQAKLLKRESHMEAPVTVSAQAAVSKRSQGQIGREDSSQEHHLSRRINELHPSDRDSQSGRSGAVARSEAWDERSQWPRAKARDADDTEYGDINAEDGGIDDDADTEDQSSDRKRLGRQDRQTQKRGRNVGDHTVDQQLKKTKSTRGQRGASGGKPRGRGGAAGVTPYAGGHNFGSEEEIPRPPRGGSAGQLSRSSSSLAERTEWPVEEALSSESSHRHYSQQSQKKGSGGPRRGGASSRGANGGPTGGRSREYPSQHYATWSGSTGGSSRSYSNYHRSNSRNYGTPQPGGNRHRYQVDHYSQSPYYDDYGYHYDYSMEDFGGQWHQPQSSERTKQSQQQQNRRDSKKNSRDRITQNRSSAPPAGTNERSESSHQLQNSQSQQQPLSQGLQPQSQSQGQQQSQQSQQLQQQQSQQQQQHEGSQSKQGRREQQSRARDQATGGKASVSASKGRGPNKKQGSTESNSSSTAGDSAVNASQPSKQASEQKVDDGRGKEVEEKPVVQLQPAPAPAVNVWNTKHPLIANTPGSTTQSSQGSEGQAAPVDLMSATIPNAGESRQSVSSADRSTTKPLVPSKGESAAPETDNGGSVTETNATTAGTEARRGRETSKSRRERPGGRDHRQPRSERRGSSRRGGSTGGGGSSTASGGGVAGPSAAAPGNASSEMTDSKYNKDRETYGQSSQAEDIPQRPPRRRRPNKEAAVENVDEQMGYGDEEYDYDYGMSRSYGRFGMPRSVRGARGYRGYHYRPYGSRNYYQYYPNSARNYYGVNQRYYVSQHRYRGGGGRSSGSGANYDGDTHGAAGVSGSASGNKRQGSVSKETVTSDGNEQEDWETASESSDVANRETRRRPPSGGSGGGGGGGGAAGGGGSGCSGSATGGNTSTTGNSVSHQQQQQSHQQRQRGRQQKSASGVVGSVPDEKSCEEGSGASTPQMAQHRKRNRMEGIDLNNFASVVAVDNLPEVTVDEEFLYDNAAEFTEVLSKNARKTKKREELKQKQEQELMTQRDPRSRQTGGRRSTGANSSDGSAKRRAVVSTGTIGSGSGSGSPPKRLQSSKMTADERRRQRKVASLTKGGMVKPLLSTLSVTDQNAAANVATASLTAAVPTFLTSGTGGSVSGGGRSSKNKLPPRLAKQQQQQQQHGSTTTSAPPLMSLDSAELEQRILAADSAGRKAHVSSTSVTDFKIESWDNRLAEDIPKVRRNAEQQMHSKSKPQTGGADSPKSSVLAPIAPPAAAANGIGSAGKADSGVDTGGEVSDRSSHSSGGATATDNRTHSPQTTSDATVTGQPISNSLLEATVVNSSLQTGDAVVDSSNEEYKLPDGFVLSCHRVTGDYDEMKASSATTSSSGTGDRNANTASKISEISAPVHEGVDNSKTAEAATCSLSDVTASVASAVSRRTSDEPLQMPPVSVTSSGQTSTVEEGTSTLNKKIALVKSCWPETSDKSLASSVSDNETLLTTATATTSSTSAVDTETNVSTVVISNVCKVKPQQKLAAPTSSASSATVGEEVNNGSVVATSSVADIHDGPPMPVFPGSSHLSTLPSSAPSFVPKTALFQQANPQDSILTASGSTGGVMYAPTGGFQHLTGTSTQPRSAYGPPVGAGAFAAPPQPTNVGRPNIPYSNANAKCPPVSLSIPMAQQNAAAKALGLGLGFGMGGSGGGDPSLLSHGAGSSNNAAVAALLQRQNSNSVGVIGPPPGPSTPQCSTYQPFNLQNNIMSNAAAAAPSAATPTGGSWPNPYGPSLGFTPGLPNPTPPGAQQAAWTFLKNQNPSATGPTAPGLPSPNTPSPAPSRQPLIFNLWPIGSGSQTQQSGSTNQQTNLGTTGNPVNPLFNTGNATAGNKYPGTTPGHSSQLGAVQTAPNLHNLVGLPQFRGGVMETSNMPSNLFDFQHQPPQQQQQPSFPPFTDFASFSQATQLPLKPPSVVAHSNTPGGVQAAASPQQMDLLTLIANNEFNASRGNDSKPPNLGSLCMTPFSQPTQQPQQSNPVSRHSLGGLNSGMTMPPTGMLGKQSAMDMAPGLSTGMNPKPPSGWGPTGMIPVSSASQFPPHVGQNIHPRPIGGSIPPARSSPNNGAICGSTVPSSSQNPNNNRRFFGNNTFSHSQSSGPQSCYANQQFSNQNYRANPGNNCSNRGGSLGYGGQRGGRGGRGGGHVSRGAAYGGSCRGHRSSNSSGGIKSSQSRNNYGSRSSTTHTEVTPRRIPAAQNLQQDNDEESDIRTVDKPQMTNTSSATSSSTTAPSSEDKPASSVEKLSVTLSGCGDNSLSEPLDSKPNESSGDIELDSTTRSAISLSPSPSDIMKNGQQVDSAVLLLDGSSEKFESVTLPSSVIQNNEPSSTALSVTSSTAAVEF